MNKVLEDGHSETNATMDLVLFEDTRKHVARILRIFRNGGGHLWIQCGSNFHSSTYSLNDLKEDSKM
jgi:hypothetical protein